MAACLPTEFLPDRESIFNLIIQLSMKKQSTTNTSLSNNHFPSAELMANWLQLIHKATEKKLITFRERMQLLLLYVEVERKFGLQHQEYISNDTTAYRQNP